MGNVPDTSGEEFSAPDMATHSIDQRDAGPANRWSVYGVDPRYAPVAPPPAYASLPSEAYTGYPGDGYTMPGYVPQYMREPSAEGSETVLSDDGLTDPSVLDNTCRVESGLCDREEPLAVNACGPWKPPGISGPWPEDEYLFDGGDSDGSVKVRPTDSWKVWIRKTRSLITKRWTATPLSSQVAGCAFMPHDLPPCVRYRWLMVTISWSAPAV